jgi:hypothetical protein
VYAARKPTRGASAQERTARARAALAFSRGTRRRPPEHGAYAVLHLTPRAGEIAAWIRSLAESDARRRAGRADARSTLAQRKHAAGVLGEIDEAIKRGDEVDVDLGRIESRSRLSQDACRWTDTARRFMDDLGLTPAARATLRRCVSWSMRVGVKRDAATEAIALA